MRVLFLKIFYAVAPFSSFIDPFYGVLLYTFISVIRPEQLTWGGTIISGVFYITIICLFLSSVLKKQIGLNLLRYGFIFSFCLYVGFLYLSTYVSPYTIPGEYQGGMEYMRGILQILLFCVCMFGILEKRPYEKMRFLIHCILFFFLFMGVWGIDQHLRGNELVEGLFGQAIIDRCAICGVFTLYLPLAVWVICKNTGWKKYFGWLCVIIFGGMVILTQSRAGFLGTITAWIVLMRYMKIRLRFLAWAAVAIVLIVPFLPSSYLERIRDIRMQDTSGNQEITDYSSASRLVLWRLGFHVFLDNPMIGVGNLNFQKASIPYGYRFAGKLDPALYFYIFGQGDRSLQVHNMFINILAEGGLFSAIPFYLMILLPLQYGNRMIKVASGPTSQSSPDILDLVMLQQTMISGLIGFFVTAVFANDRLMDYFYWNLTLSYLVSMKLEMRLSQLPVRTVNHEAS